MNDIITDVIAKQLAQQIKNNQPIESYKRIVTDKEIDHFFTCKKHKCDMCKEITNRRLLE